MNDDFRTKMKVFKEMNGGKQGYLQVNQNLDLYSQQIDGSIRGIEDIVQKEREGDKAMVSATGGASTSFVDLNRGELDQFRRKNFS